MRMRDCWLKDKSHFTPSVIISYRCEVCTFLFVIRYVCLRKKPLLIFLICFILFFGCLFLSPSFPLSSQHIFVQGVRLSWVGHAIRRPHIKTYSGLPIIMFQATILTVRLMWAHSNLRHLAYSVCVFCQFKVPFRAKLHRLFDSSSCQCFRSACETP